MGRQRRAAAGETAAAGEGSQGTGPVVAGQVQGSDLQLSGPYIPIRHGEGGTAQALANRRQAQKTGTQLIEQWRYGHWLTGEASRRQQQQPLNLFGTAPGQFHSHRSAHGGSDQPNPGGAAAGEHLLQHTLQVIEHGAWSVGATDRSGAEAKAK